MVGSSRPPHTKTTPKGLREQLYRRRSHDLCASDVDPVMWTEHVRNPFLFDPEVAVAIHDAREIRQNFAKSHETTSAWPRKADRLHLA